MSDAALEREYDKLGAPQFEIERIKMQLIKYRKLLVDFEMECSGTGEWTDTMKATHEDMKRCVSQLEARLQSFEQVKLAEESLSTPVRAQTWTEFLFCRPAPND